MKKIGIIGAGIMGGGMVSNYLKNGYEVIVWNRTKQKLDPFLKQGATAAASPKEVAEKADIVFDVTANDESSRAVWLGETGILAGAKKDSVLIASGTFSVKWGDELGKLCAGSGFTFFDMPLTGGRAAAESGKLLLLVGGDEKQLEVVKSDLAAISEKVLYFGKTGSGMRYKLLLNTLQGIHVMAFGEVMKLAEKGGMDIQKVGDALAERMGGGPTKIAWRDYAVTPESTNFSVQWIAKDLRYAKEFAESLETPLLDDASKKFEQLIQKGLGEADWTIIEKN